MLECRVCHKLFPTLGGLAQHSAHKHPDNTDFDARCPECGEAAHLYKRGRGTQWACYVCNTWTHCYPGSFCPAGTLASKRVHVMRRRVVQAFEEMQERLGLRSRQAYAVMAQSMGISPAECQMSTFDWERCLKALAACADLQSKAYETTVADADHSAQIGCVGDKEMTHGG